MIILPQRQTALVAKQAAEVDLLTGGRFRLGVGIGWNEVEYEALGEDFTNRGRRFEEQIELLRRLWTEPVVDFDGRWHTVTGGRDQPAAGPAADPDLDRRLGRGGAPARGRLADGFFPQRPLEGGWPATMERMRGWARRRAATRPRSASRGG